MNGFIYAIEADNGLVKIGYTDHLKNRLSQLRANNCLPLTPLGYARGTVEQEADLHILLDGEHVRGEWFKFGCLVEHFVSLLAPWPDRASQKAKKLAPPGRTVEIINRFGGRRSLAVTLGSISYDAVKQWGRRDEIPGRWHLELLRLAEHLGIELSSDELAAQVNPTAETRVSA